jgi:hypothetical protein
LPHIKKAALDFQRGFVKLEVDVLNLIKRDGVCNPVPNVSEMSELSGYA